MKSATSLFARFSGFDAEACGSGFEIRQCSRFNIKAERDAVRHALKTHAAYYQTYEVSAEAGVAQNFSGRNFVRQSRVLTKGELAAHMLKAAADAIERFELPDDIVPKFMAPTLAAIALTEKDPDNAVYLASPLRASLFTRVHAEDKVFDGRGRLLWPRTTAHTKKP